MNALAKRMFYFDELVGSAHTLVTESAGMLKTTRDFEQGLKVSRGELVSDFTPSDIEENLGDCDFANDFADSLKENLDNLRKVCKKTKNDCIARKHRLDDALIGLRKDMGETAPAAPPAVKQMMEEELVELSEFNDMTISKTFYGLHDACSQWFDNMGEGVATLQNEYVLEAIKQVDSIKSTLMTNDREGYGAVKDILFTLLDTAKDIQMSTETAQQAFSRNTGKIARYIGKRPVWTYQHKYSLRTTGDCIHYAEITMKHFDKVHAAFEKYADVLLPALKESTAVAMKARLGKTNK